MYPYPDKMNVNEFISKHHPDIGKDPWICYCECCIDKDGNIYECTPSHQEFAFSYACKQLNYSREELYEMIPIWASPIHWVAEKFSLVFLWYDFGIAYEGYESNVGKEIRLLADSGMLFAKDRIQISHEYSLVRGKS